MSGISDDNPEEDQKRQKRFGDALNRHGYSFQNAILKALEQTRKLGQTLWRFEVAEFPVELNGSTKIDFILQSRPSDYLMIAECKRVNPAYSDWFFLRSPYIRRNNGDAFFMEDVRWVIETGLPRITSFGCEGSFFETKHYYHIGIDVKTEKSGDASGDKNQAIEAAAGQVCRGVNGLVHYFKDNPIVLGPNKRRILIPVIFTTAKLFVSEADLSETNLESGNLDPSKLKAIETPFVLYQYHLSSGIKHQMGGSRYDDLSSILAADFIRTIPIINAAHASMFFRKFRVNHIDPLKISGP